jgi:putative phage-type endonuclease
MERENWLAARKNGLGGSDAAVVLGLSPWKTEFDLWAEKRGEIADSFGDTTPEHVLWGNILEDAVAKEYANRRGVTVRRSPEMRWSKEHPYMFANIDRKIQGQNKLLEVKTTNSMSFSRNDWGEEFTNQVPEYYLTQVMHYLAVTGYSEGDLAVLIGGQEMKIYTIKRDEHLIDIICAQEGEFWNKVITNVAPVVDYNHKSAVDMLKRRYPGTNGNVVDLAGEIGLAHDKLQALNASIKEQSDAKSALTAMIMDAVGDNTAGKLPDGSYYRRKEMPESERAFTVKARVDFRHVKNLTV